MPINGITGRVRAPRTLKIRLGYKKKGERGDYPKDSDAFILRSEDQAKDGVAAKTLAAYGKGKIEEAEGEVHSLGKALRMMLPWDFDLTYDGHEVGLELMNRAWSHSKLRCFGTGGDVDGEATCREEAMATAIAKATHHKAVASEDSKSWSVVCRGPRCPYWNSNLATDKSATCHREMRLWAWLLDPAVDPEDKNFLEKLAAVEISSGSFNGMVDVQSGFKTIHALVGRTALIPFTLRRVPRTVLSEGKRVSKATLLVDFDQDEVIRFGYSDTKLALVRPEVRKQLLAQKRELLELAALEANYDSMKDIQPRLEERRLGLPSPSESKETKAPSAIVSEADENLVGDRDQVVADAVDAAEPAQLSDEQLNAKLSQQERNQLKELCGGQPGEPETLTKFFELVAAAHREFGTGQTPRDLSSLTVRHALWIKNALQQEAGE